MGGKSSKVAKEDKPALEEAKTTHKLVLTDKGYKAVPKDVFKCSDLVMLNLSINKIAKIPGKIGKLTGLKHLNLSRNSIKALPKQIGKLTELESLSLAGNQLKTLPAEMSELSKLAALSVGTNPLDLEKITASLGTLPPTITSLDLSFLELKVVPKEIARMPLKMLHLGGNAIKELPMGLTTITTLSELHVGRNKLSQLPATIGKLPLVRLIIDNNKKMKDLPASLGRTRTLTLLSRTGCSLSAIPEDLRQGPLDELQRYLRGGADLSSEEEALDLGAGVGGEADADPADADSADALRQPDAYLDSDSDGDARRDGAGEEGIDWEPSSGGLEALDERWVDFSDDSVKGDDPEALESEEHSPGVRDGPSSSDVVLDLDSSTDSGAVTPEPLPSHLRYEPHSSLLFPAGDEEELPSFVHRPGDDTRSVADAAPAPTGVFAPRQRWEIPPLPETHKVSLVDIHFSERAPMRRLKPDAPRVSHDSRILIHSQPAWDPHTGQPWSAPLS